MALQCPACGRTMTEREEGGVRVDICAGGCGGVWFDAFELKKFDEPHEHAGAALLEVPRDPNLEVDQEKKRPCPRCPGVTMMRHFYSVAQKVVVDECPQCGGVWLDPGELAEIRGLYASEAEREAAADRYFSAVVSGPFREMRTKGAADLARARRFAHMFRFICPTYYIPGKQDWGAF